MSKENEFNKLDRLKIALKPLYFIFFSISCFPSSMNVIMQLLVWWIYYSQWREIIIIIIFSGLYPLCSYIWIVMYKLWSIVYVLCVLNCCAVHLVYISSPICTCGLELTCHHNTVGSVYNLINVLVYNQYWQSYTDYTDYNNYLNPERNRYYTTFSSDLYVRQVAIIVCY